MTKPAIAGFFLNRRARKKAAACAGLPQRGFTAIEMAIIMVIIGLIISGVLKATELTANSQARHLITQQDAIRAAYLGFQDRYRALAGDYPGSAASRNIPGIAPDLGGNGDGILGNAGSHEQTIAWTHLSASGFLAAGYVMSSPTEPVHAGNTPRNVYQAFLQIADDSNLAASGTAIRRNVKTGNQVPPGILAEIDRKIDDGYANQGTFRFSGFNGAATPPQEMLCYSATQGNWNIESNYDNCGGASLL